MRLIEPDWPRHARVRAVVTTREGGTSPTPWDSLNLAGHVGDDPQRVAENRRRLRRALGLAHEPAWLEQVHGTDVLRIPQSDPDAAVAMRADAAWTDRPGQACVIMTADCLPVLFADDAGGCVAAAHAGWRGLAAGVLERTLAAMPVPPVSISAWLGPAIGPTAFEVGPEVVEVFERAMEVPAGAFATGRGDRRFGDLFALARARLRRAGVDRVHGGGSCTHTDRSQFFSYRRDGQCGRMATLIWLDG